LHNQCQVRIKFNFTKSYLHQVIPFLSFDLLKNQISDLFCQYLKFCLIFHLSKLIPDSIFSPEEKLRTCQRFTTRVKFYFLIFEFTAKTNINVILADFLRFKYRNSWRNDWRIKLKIDISIESPYCSVTRHHSILYRLYCIVYTRWCWIRIFIASRLSSFQKSPEAQTEG